MAYRESQPQQLKCPRCSNQLPPQDIATCAKGCGTWVSQFAASVAFREGETVENNLMRWWRVREPCPVCGDKMSLRGGDEPALFQGCDVHGYFVDADVVEHTGLSRPGLDAALAAKSEDTSAVEAEREAIENLALERAREREAREQERPQLEASWRRFTTDPVDPYESVEAALHQGSTSPLIEELRRLAARVTELEKRMQELDRGGGR